jgi:hypothetical protein
MSLRLQLLAVGLLTLVLPWTGFLYVQEMEAVLRASFEQSLLARAATVATALEEQNAALCAPPECDPQRAGGTVYATALAREPELDGVPDDHWNVARRQGSRSEPTTASGPARMAGSSISSSASRIATSSIRNSGAAAVRRSRRARHGVGRAALVAVHDGCAGHFPRSGDWAGSVRAERNLRRANHRGMAGDSGGYALEVRVPLNLIGASLGVGIIDVDRGAAYGELQATWDETTGALGRFIRQVPELQSSLGQFGGAAGRFRVLDKDGWVLAATGRRRARRSVRRGRGPRRRLFPLAARARRPAATARATDGPRRRREAAASARGE